MRERDFYSRDALDARKRREQGLGIRDRGRREGVGSRVQGVEKNRTLG
jgi:hypothetical protein